MKALIDRQYEWNFWGNRRTLGMLRDNGAGEGKMLDLMSHILAAERIWLTRLQGKDTKGLEIFPSFSLDECTQRMDDNENDWNGFLAKLEPDKLLYKLSYANQSGNRFETVVADILLHVASHGHYHRGQINAQARAAGWQPVYTDFILFTREMDQALSS